MGDHGAGFQTTRGSRRMRIGALAAFATAAWPNVATAAPGDPVAIGSATLDPILTARLRHEGVDRAGMPDDAEALTFRVRTGAELEIDGFSILAEGEGTVALNGDYNDTLPGNGIEPFPVVADPESLELNRLQVSYLQDGTGITVGRQRIILGNARFVGNSGWRQNEQTFDAVRGQAKVGPVLLDATYAVSQRTVFGTDSPNEHFDGDFVLLSGGIDLPMVDAEAFAYLIDYDTRIVFSSQTYGVSARAEVGVSAAAQLDARLSYARQSDYGANRVAYDAEYWHAELGFRLLGFALTAGHERLGSDGGVAAFQTPLATLHAFNGWADQFGTTPAAGLRDSYAAIGRSFGVPFLPGLKAGLTYHQFKSDFGGLDYGNEWDASVGFELGRVGLLAKYANYQADEFASDNEKFWLQAEISF